MPRAIAPEVTTTTSTPAPCSAATSSQIRATTDRRSAPLSSATIDDPSLTTATGTLGGIELEHRAADLDVVAGLEPRALERGDHAHALQPPLDVGLGLLVVEVPAQEEALDGVAAHDPHAARTAGDRELAVGRRPEDGEVGDLVLAGALGLGFGERHAREQLAAQLLQAGAGRA